MPVYLASNPTSYKPNSRIPGIRTKPQVERLNQSSTTLTIGLINNMSDGAMEATERQFLSLLDSASVDMTIELSLYSLPGVPRGEFGTEHIDNYYSNVETLWDTKLDGLIVTGREPSTPNLEEEPYWESLTRVVEWAQNNTYSTIWSCLAAHAAVLYLDGIRRVKSNQKKFGVFTCAQQRDHALLAGAPSRFNVPHSRWNGLREEELTDGGYSVLTRAADIGVDTFIKQQNSLFVFFQGHPEYESHTLLLEYRRDIGRYLRGETTMFPLVPVDYFDRDTVKTLTALERACNIRPQEALLAEAYRALDATSIENSWHSTTVGTYRNWLESISAQKHLQVKHAKVAVEVDDDPTLLLSPEKNGPHSNIYAVSRTQVRPRLLRAAR